MQREDEGLCLAGERFCAAGRSLHFSEVGILGGCDEEMICCDREGRIAERTGRMAGERM
jgi:hypothetical protein